MEKQKIGINLLPFAIGLLLLVVNAAGFFLGPIVKSDREEKTPVPGYDYKTLSWEEAKRQFRELPEKDISPEEKAQVLFKLVSESFVHTPSSYKITLWENWIMWLGGNLLNKKYLKSQDPDFLWKRGGGFCNQASIIFAAKGKELGLKTRIIGLKGHVVAEVYLPDKGWRVVDPDMGIFWDHDLDSFGTNPNIEQVKSELFARGFSEEISEHFARIYTSQENNFRIDYPTSPNRLFLEKITNGLKWFIPLGLVGVGLGKQANYFRKKLFKLRPQNL